MNMTPVLQATWSVQIAIPMRCFNSQITTGLPALAGARIAIRLSKSVFFRDEGYDSFPTMDMTKVLVATGGAQLAIPIILCNKSMTKVPPA